MCVCGCVSCSRSRAHTRRAGDLETVVHGDRDVVNMVIPHPERFQVVSSGIENHIKVFEPRRDGPIPLDTVANVRAARRWR